MKTIKVVSITDTVHPKYGKLVVGMELKIDEKDFGDQIFKKKTSSPSTGSGQAAPSTGSGQATTAHSTGSGQAGPAAAKEKSVNTQKQGGKK